MPYATNRLDGNRIYHEEWGGGGEPVVLYTGFLDPLLMAQRSELAQTLRDEFRVVFADHRGHGRSDAPHDAGSYALQTRVADHTAVLDDLGIDRAHVIGFSWGARLGFAIGAQVPDRTRSLVACGNQPYAWDLTTPIARAVASAAQARSMEGFMEVFEEGFGVRFPEPQRTLDLQNDLEAIRAAWASVSAEGAISDDLPSWTVPCLIAAGTEDEIFDAAQRAAHEIPTATLLPLPGHTHISAEGEVDTLVPAVRDFLHGLAGAV